jgi:hypothetical protein
MKPDFSFFLVAACASVVSGAVVPAGRQTESLLQRVPSSADATMWWEPDGSRAGTNAALEKAFGWKDGDAVRVLENLLKGELAKPGGGDSNTVARALDALRLSGDASVANTLDALLFSEKVPFRPELFCTRVAFCGMAARVFARAFVERCPRQTRQACYAAAVPLTEAGEGAATRQRLQTLSVLQECAAVETDAAPAAVLDRALASVSVWGARNTRRRVARRFAGAAGAAGEYFKKVSAEMGPPRKPDKADFLSELFQPPWDNGYPQPGHKEGMQKWLNSWFAQDYEKTESGVVRMLEEIYLDELAKKDMTAEAMYFRGNVLAAIFNSDDIDSTNMLHKALVADWNPDRLFAVQKIIFAVGGDALPAVRAVLKDKTKFSVGDRGSCFYLIAEWVSSNGHSRENVTSQTIVFLKEFLLHDTDCLVAVDGALIRIDPAWKTCGDRKRLVTEQVSRQKNDYIRNYCINVLKEFGETGEDGRGK